MFSCILSFGDMPLVLSSYKLRFGTKVPVQYPYLIILFPVNIAKINGHFHIHFLK